MSTANTEPTTGTDMALPKIRLPATSVRSLEGTQDGNPCCAARSLTKSSRSSDSVLPWPSPGAKAWSIGPRAVRHWQMSSCGR